MTGERSHLYTGGQRVFIVTFVLEVVVIIKYDIFSQLLRPYEIKSREAKQVTAKVPSCPRCDGQPGSWRWLRTGLCVLLSMAGAGTDPSNTALPSPRPH